MDSAGDTVLQLQVHFRDGVVGENGGVRDITCTSKNAGQWGCNQGCHRQCMNACIARQTSRSSFRQSIMPSNSEALLLPTTRCMHSFHCRFNFGGCRIERTDGSRLNHVADSESLDRLVLGDAAGAVGAAHGLDVAAAVLVTTAVGRNKSSQFSRFKKCLSVEIENKAFLLPS